VLEELLRISMRGKAVHHQKRNRTLAQSLGEFDFEKTAISNRLDDPLYDASETRGHASVQNRDGNFSPLQCGLATCDVARTLFGRQRGERVDGVASRRLGGLAQKIRVMAETPRSNRPGEMLDPFRIRTWHGQAFETAGKLGVDLVPIESHIERRVENPRGLRASLHARHDASMPRGRPDDHDLARFVPRITLLLLSGFVLFLLSTGLYLWPVLHEPAPPGAIPDYYKERIRARLEGKVIWFLAGSMITVTLIGARPSTRGKG